MRVRKGELTVVGNHHDIPICDEIPDWGIDEEECFNYKGNRYFLSEFFTTYGITYFSDYDGYSSDSYFSGVLIKLSKDRESVRAYRFFC